MTALTTLACVQALLLTGPALSAPVPQNAAQPSSPPPSSATRSSATPSALDAAALAAQREQRAVGVARFTAPDYKPGLLRHMVMFAFRPGTTAAQRAEVTRRFIALASLSRRPDGKPVVTSIETGAQNSGENTDLGLEQGYLVTFASEGDRNFYVGRPIVTEPRFFDPAHDAFKTFAAPYLTKGVVFDFTPGAPAVP
ncbi:stress responsive protein [Acetobacter orleanensis]|nr:stress responsive protein [Acetobacter orleanensis]